MHTNDPKVDFVLAGLAEEFVKRCRHGERPELVEYTARNPELAGRIHELFPILAEIEHVGAGRFGRKDEGTDSRRQQVGDYRLLREIGRGGMGVVYEAEQLSLGRRVALKILPSHVGQDGQALERFRREARFAAKLHHTNIVPVFEVGREGDVCYYAMQLIQGQGLDQVIAELRRSRSQAEPRRFGAGPPPQGTTLAHQPLASDTALSVLTGRFPKTELEFMMTPPGLVAAEGSATSLPDVELGRRHYFQSIARMIYQAATGLGFAHERGVIHRDIKPLNLLLDSEGVVWITDFGLAKATGGDDLTHSGDVLGTIRYMAPERFRDEADALSDWWTPPCQ